MTPSAAASPRRQLIGRAARDWRQQLIDISGNNRLLYYRDLKIGTLDLARADADAVERLLRGDTVRLSRFFSDGPELSDAQKRARTIAGKAQQAAEEYGIKISFLALGMATWAPPTEDGGFGAGLSVDTVDAHDPTSLLDDEIPGRARAQRRPPRYSPTPNAPVLLRAVELAARRGTSYGYELSVTGESQLNPVLAHLLSTQFRVRLDDPALFEGVDESLGELSGVLRRLRTACADVPGFATTERTIIGSFTYTKQPMVEDCENLDALVGSDLIAAVAGDPEAIEASRTAGGELREDAPDFDPPASEFLVLDADASQSYVVNAAVAGQ